MSNMINMFWNFLDFSSIAFYGYIVGSTICYWFWLSEVNKKVAEQHATGLKVRDTLIHFRKHFRMIYIVAVCSILYLHLQSTWIIEYLSSIVSINDHIWTFSDIMNGVAFTVFIQHIQWEDKQNTKFLGIDL